MLIADLVIPLAPTDLRELVVGRLAFSTPVSVFLHAQDAGVKQTRALGVNERGEQHLLWA